MAHRLLAKQIARATGPDGRIDVDKLIQQVSTAYDEADRDRRRVDRSIELMIAELEQTRQRLLDALDLVPGGIAIFDSDDRYVFWNKRYAEMFNREKIAVGVSFEDELRSALATAQTPRDSATEDDWVRRRVAAHRQKAHSAEVQMHDGRWMQVDDRRTADGGTVSLRMDITDLKQREQSFRLLFEANPVAMMVFDRDDLTILEVNAAAAVLYGYSRDEFIGLGLLDLIPPDRHEAVLSTCRTVEGQIRGEHPPCHVTADGEQREVDVYVHSLIRNGRPARLVAVIDVTDRRRAEAATRRAEHFLEKLIGHIPAAMTVKDANTLRYRYVNLAAEEHYGIARSKMLDRTVFDVHPPLQAESMDNHDRETLRSGQPMNLPARPLSTWRGVRLLSSKRIPIMGPDNRPEHLLTVIDDVTEWKAAEDRIAFLARHDPLSGLPNRTHFSERLAETFATASEDGTQFALLSIDLDRFKEANDVLGHSAGDAALAEIAKCLSAAAGDCFLARIGGDEFAVIAPIETAEAAVELSERFMECRLRDYRVAGKAVDIGLSIGVALYPGDGGTPSELLVNADAALHRAKADGRGTVRYFTAAVDEQLRQRRALRLELAEAIASDQLVLHYQPQTTMSGEVTGFEALIRWQHPKHGLVPPSEFIPIAEEAELIAALGEWTLRAACREAACWTTPLTVAVNVSPSQLHQGDLARLICDILVATGLSPDRLEIEVTEGVLIEDYERSLAILRRIKALGVRIAMDDFGTGYSSLSYLHAFPLDKIKIDRSFVVGLNRGREAAAIVKAIVALGSGLGLPVLAEGVETHEQIAFLRSENCHGMQGFAIGRPGPIADYAALVNDPAPRLVPLPIRHQKTA